MSFLESFRVLLSRLASILALFLYPCSFTDYRDGIRVRWSYISKPSQADHEAYALVFPLNPSKLSSSSSPLITPPPLTLAPIRCTAEILPAPAKVRSTATQSIPTLLIHNRTARLALARNTCLGLRLRWLVLVVAFSEASLAAVAAVDRLVLDIVLGTTGRVLVDGRRDSEGWWWRRRMWCRL